MRIEIVVNPKLAWRWQADLAAALRAAGHAVEVAAGGGSGLPPAIDALLRLEGAIYRSRSPRPSDRIDGSAFGGLATAGTGGPSDLVIDLTGADQPDRAGVPVIRPFCEGTADPLGGIVNLLEGRIPALEVRSAAGVHAAGLPAVENRVVLSAAIDNVASRIVDLLGSAVAAWPATIANAPQPDIRPAGLPSITAGRFALAGIGRRAGGRIARALRGSDAWKVGWRHVDGDGVRETGRWPDADYRWLPDDRQRYFADPLVHIADGRTWVFCEEYPFASGKGVVSVFEIDGRGEAGPPRVVLERPYHLSYPFVFTRDGATWMISETAATRRIELYRAVRFPDRWDLAAVLHEGGHISDATMIEFGGRLWLFATETAPNGSTWDALSLFHAEKLTGPWTAHSANPVLVDAGAARPAGAMAISGGRIWRVAQDCRAGYGLGLTFAVVEEIDTQRYAQRVIGHLGPAPAWGMKGVHTLNRTGPIEVVDAFGRA